MDPNQLCENTAPLILDTNLIVPSSINKYLKPSQRESLRFIFSRHIYKDGAILNNGEELLEILPLSIFISMFINSEKDLVSRRSYFLIVILENFKERLNRWRYYLIYFEIICNVQYLGKNVVPSDKASIFILNSKRFDEHVNFLKVKNWTSIILDNFTEQSIHTELNRLKIFKSESRFCLSRKNIYCSRKYFWSMFEWINKSDILGTSFSDFEKHNFQYYFNIHVKNSGKMSKIDISKLLQALRIKRKYISRKKLTDKDKEDTIKLFSGQPWTLEKKEEGLSTVQTANQLEYSPDKVTNNEELSTVQSVNRPVQSHNNVTNTGTSKEEKKPTSSKIPTTEKVEDTDQSHSTETQFNIHSFLDSFL